jgi:asparagine synthase (glutamine-hydrolysing)
MPDNSRINNVPFLVTFDLTDFAFSGVNREPTKFLECAAIFRGYIANRKNIIQESCEYLEGNLLTDAQIFCAAYRKWGAGLQKKVLGEYCVIIHDPRTQAVFITLDSFGLRPVFYSVSNRKFYCSSSLGLLVEHLGCSKLCDEYVADYLTLLQHHGNKTIYEDCRRLEPGHSLFLKKDDLQDLQTWTFSGIPSIKLDSSEAYQERFRELFSEGIMAASGTKTWAELSGGLDSSSIFCMAKELKVPGLEAVSLVYSKSASADETSWMKDCLRGSTVGWNQLDENIEAPLSEPPDRWLPFPHQALLSWKAFARYQRLIEKNQVDVVLSGMGGDQVCYYGAFWNWFIADDLRCLRFGNLAGKIREWTHASGKTRSYRHFIDEYGIRPLKNYYYGHRILERNHQRIYCPWMKLDFLKRSGLNDRIQFGSKPRLNSVVHQCFAENIQLTSYSNEQHWNQLLTNWEMRFPFLYRPLVEFMYGIPLTQKTNPDCDRPLQRQSLVGILPESIRLRKSKQGPDQAFYDGLSRNRPLINLLTVKPQIVERGYVDGDMWREAVYKATFGSIPRFSTFFASVALELWFQQKNWQSIQT